MITNENRFDYLNKTYDIEVLGISNGRILYIKNGYIHEIHKNSISRLILDNHCTIVDSDYIRWFNDNILEGTPLIAISIDKGILNILNRETNIFCKFNRGQSIDLDRMISLTTKPNKYREKIIEILGPKYNYDKCWPESVTEKVIIRCPIHGEYKATVSNIIHNHSGCPECARELKGYSRSVFIKSCKKNNNGKGLLYLIRIENEEEDFIKIGITSYPTIHNRISELKRLYGNVNLVFQYESDPSFIYNLEHKLHRQFRNYKYRPGKQFAGMFECYDPYYTDKMIENICKFL